MSKNGLGVLAALLLLSSGLVAEDLQVPWANKFFAPKDTPFVIVHDFGTVARGTIVTHKFPMTNPYAVPMQIIEPKPTCGCVSVMEGTRKLAPLESGYLEIKLDTNKYDGGFKKVTIPVTFQHNSNIDGKSSFFQSTAMLEVHIISRRDITLTPGQFEFGQVALGQEPTRAATLVYAGNVRDWKLTEVGYDKELLDVKVVPINGQRGTINYQITTTLKKTSKPGELNQQIILKTNDPTNPNIIINVRAIVESPLNAIPDTATLGKVKLNETKDQRIVLTSDRPFRIAGARGQIEKELIIEADIRSEKKQHVIIVKFSPKKVGPFKQLLEVQNNRGEVVTITVEAEVIE